MKKLLILAAMLVLAASCAQDKAPKYLVLYYSQTNTTKAVAEEMQQRVKERRAMAAGKNETVTVSPLGVLAVMVHMLCPELIGHGSTAQRQARMAGICPLDSICCQHTDCIYAGSVEISQGKSPPKTKNT